MSFTVGGSTPQLTFADATVQNTAALPLTGGSVSADITVNGLTVGRGAGAVATNTAVGYQAGYAVTTGSPFTALGYQAGLSTTTAIWTTAIGYQALMNNTTGGNNTAVGRALVSNTTASDNTAMGMNALYYNTTASNNTAFGSGALFVNTTASNNTAVGYQAGYNNTTGTLNTFIGRLAGYPCTTGSYNTCLGDEAGYGTISLTSGGYNTIVGYAVSTGGSTDTYEIVVGSGALIVGKGSGTGFIAPGSTNGTGGGGVYQGNNSSTWSITSDQRLKKNIVDNTVGLTAINGIKVRNFEYRLPDEITDLDKSNAVAITGVQLGPIAQELQQVLPDCVKTESTGVMSVDSSDVLWHLVTAVQQLSAQVTALQAKVGV
jgi:hypothetical protein